MTQSQVQRPQIRVDGTLQNVEFATVYSTNRNTIFIFCQRFNVGFELYRSRARQIHCRKGNPTFVPGRVPLPRPKMEIVYVPDCGLWGLRYSFDEALERQQRQEAPHASLGASSNAPKAPALTPEDEKRLGERQLAKFAKRYPHGAAWTFTTTGT